MSRSRFGLFCFNVFGVQRSVQDFRFDVSGGWFELLGLEVSGGLAFERRRRTYWGVRHPNLAFLNGPLDTGYVIASYSHAFISSWEPMISMVFLRALLSAVSCFPMRSTHPRDARDVQGLQGVREDDQDTHHHARDLRRLRGARGPQRVRDGSSIFKCPEVG